MNLAPGHMNRDAVTTLVQMDKAIMKATREFQAAIGNHQSQLARRLGVKSQTVQAWFKEGRISPWGAIEIARHFPAFSRERLRPDIIDWKGLKIRKPGRV